MFIKNTLAESDPLTLSIINDEAARQNNTIDLIASENIVSKAVLEALGSPLTNKYAEGYPSKRYYGGCHYVDKIENLAIERLCALFGAKYANVQPHSGSQSNQAVFMALLEPGDKILGLELSSGGHLTHGSKVNISGKWFAPISYTTNDKGILDYDAIEQIAMLERPKIIIAGYSAYPREIDFARFRQIADNCGAYLMADIAHVAGLIAAQLFSNPLPFAHVVTSTTHKTLRGPRGGIVMTNDEQIAKKINSAVFPGLQGGPLMNVIAAKAVAFYEASTPDYREYMSFVVENSKTLAKTLMMRGYDIVTGGTDNHLLVLDLSRYKGINGMQAQQILEDAYIICNKNTVPNDIRGPRETSGLRFGTPSVTSRGLRANEVNILGELIADILDAAIAYTSIEGNSSLEGSEKIAKVVRATRSAIADICQKFPIHY